jgi:putative tryptophan/tyrosine transport system substrate-binding protein
MNRRRSTAILFAMSLLPIAGLAQRTGRTYRLGMMANNPRPDWAVKDPYLQAFVDRLRELGFAEERNLVIELRLIEGKTERVPGLAAELARLNCDVLLSTGTEDRLVALERATRDTPIVAVAVDYDPLATGHIASLARPGGRITGITHLQSELPAKRVELLRDLLPNARRIAVLTDYSNTGQLASAQAGAKQLGLQLQVLELKAQPYDYENAFAEAVRAKAEAVLVLGSSNFVTARPRITALALKHRLPSMFHHSVWAEFGGLISYGANFTTTFRRAAEQVAMIFDGKKPADMPVEQPTRFELVLNMKTAKALGLKIPHTIALRADQVIE